MHISAHLKMDGWNTIVSTSPPVGKLQKIHQGSDEDAAAKLEAVKGGRSAHRSRVIGAHPTLRMTTLDLCADEVY